jgi:hypothetical protein
VRGVTSRVTHPQQDSSQKAKAVTKPAENAEYQKNGLRADFRRCGEFLSGVVHHIVRMKKPTRKPRIPNSAISIAPPSWLTAYHLLALWALSIVLLVPATTDLSPAPAPIVSLGPFRPTPGHKVLSIAQRLSMGTFDGGREIRFANSAGACKPAHVLPPSCQSVAGSRRARTRVGVSEHSADSPEHNRLR